MGRFIIMGVNDGSDKGVKYFKKMMFLRTRLGLKSRGKGILYTMGLSEDIQGYIRVRKCTDRTTRRNVRTLFGGSKVKRKNQG